MRLSITSLALVGLLAAPAFAQEGEPAHEEHQAAHEEHAADDHGAEEHGAEAHGDEHSEHAEHGAHHAVTLDAIIHDPTFRAALVAFLCLLILFARFARPAVRRGLKKRQRSIEEQLAEAARIKADAEAMAKDYEERLARLDDEVKKVRDEMIEAAEAERERVIREAEEKAALMRKDAKFQIEQRMKQLRDDLTREAVEAAIAAARAVLTEKTTPADQTRLANDYVQQVADAAKEKRA